MKAKRRWRRMHGFINVTGNVNGLHGDVFASRGTFVAEADAGHGRGVFMRRRFSTEVAAKRAVEAWLSRHSTPKRPRAAGGRR